MPDLAAWIDALRLDLLLRLVLAAILGGAVGLERELSGKPAGLRTNMLICVGAALLTELSILISQIGAPGGGADPGRIAAQVVSGIGFLGAGTILQARGHVTGLTTAATLWVVAAIGIAAGAAAYPEAVGATLLVLVALVLLNRVEDAVLRRGITRRYAVSVPADPADAERVSALFREHGLRVRTASLQREGDEEMRVTVEVTGPEEKHERAARVLAVAPGVRIVSWDR